eukprot:GFUD01013668.1.p1 GENE.GFUD01013668.1~~GFUD01013668.1.p1  ORF type:complete len:641 (+),score=136.04 GFUD01013668.1:337-2259(+)
MDTHTSTFLLLTTFIFLVSSQDVPRVKSRLGFIEGTFKVSEPSTRKFSAFEGIPFAVPPIETLRFKPPLKSDVFYKPHEALKATQFKAECPQFDMYAKEYKGSEDCLYLNVFTPETKFHGSVSYPVMVWIHGGAFQMGSSSSESYGPERILEEDIVLVTINYRLGPLGFLTTGDDIAPPNVGILDQRMALRWVKENIEAFAGDPERVTLFGESAGGISTMAHLASPGSRGLFHQAIAMSGVWGEVPFLHKSKKPTEYTDMLATQLGCDVDKSSLDIIQCLQQKSPKEILEQASSFRTFNFLPEPFTPSVDDYMPNPILPMPLHQVWDDPSFSPVPLMIGGNKDDGILMLLEFLKDEKLYSRVNENFSTELPAILLGVDPDAAAADEGETATSEVLRNSYLPGDGNFSVDATEQMVRLFTDVHFLAPIDKTVRDLTTKTDSIFYYNYQHKGSFSLPMAMGIWENYGVSHVDELFLLFKFAQVSSSWLGDLALQTEDDIQVSQKLVQLWTHFAKHGRPTEDDSWKSVQESKKMEYAIIDSGEIRMDYPKDFASKMELIESMFNLARIHRVFDMEEHPALKKMREDRARLFEEEMEADKAKQMDEIKAKQEGWKLKTEEVYEDDIDPWADDEDLTPADTHDEL